MRGKKLFALVVFFFSLVSSLYSQSSHIHTNDIRRVMGQLFDFHIDKKEISTQILARSLRVYLNQFDSTHTYLLVDEISSYVIPKEGFLQAMLQDYQRDQFGVYVALNKTIEKSIDRCRGWREQWVQNPEKLVKEAREMKGPFSVDRPFAADANELKQRHYEQFLHLISYQCRQLEHSSCPIAGKEERIVKMSERQLLLLENAYLGLDEEGKKLKETEKEHQACLRILKALAHSLDSHTAYFSPEEAFAMKVQLEKGMCGIGVVLHEGIDGVVIADMVKGGPAEKNGALHVGDTIVEVDGQSIRDYSFPKVLDILRGEEGTRVVLGIVRKEKQDETALLRIEMTRERMTLEDKRVDISSEPFGDGIIGKITLYSFYEGEDGVSSEKDLRKAITELREQGPLYGLVLDMRENCGGFLSQAVRVSGLFISSGVVVVSKYSDGTLKYYRAVDGTKFYDGPLVVLVSRGSASATEIVAQALQDYGVAVVVGDEQTYGKGTIQHQTVTNDQTNSFFKVTIGRYYTVSGKSTQIDGVKADVVVPTDLNFEELGESYLHFPLPPDRIESVFHDPLADVDLYARKWFSKHYLPALQPQELKWKSKIGLLRENSQKRLAANRNFQLFLQKMKDRTPTPTERPFGANDLQLEESVNILKDMIYLQNQPLLVGN